MCLACCMCARNKSGGGLVVGLYRGFDFPIEEGVHQNFLSTNLGSLKMLAQVFMSMLINGFF